jgi:lysozyme
MNTATLDLIKGFESLHDGDLKKIGLQPKLDPIGIWTEGYGRAMIDPATKQFLKGINNKAKAASLHTINTEGEAVIALNEDLVRYSGYAKNALGTQYWEKLNDNQKGALTSFVYNCGVGKPLYKIFKNISLWIDKKMLQKELIAYWETSVIKGGGKVLPGLVRRRKAEAKLFFA